MQVENTPDASRSHGSTLTSGSRSVNTFRVLSDENAPVTCSSGQPVRSTGSALLPRENEVQHPLVKLVKPAESVFHLGDRRNRIFSFRSEAFIRHGYRVWRQSRNEL